MQLDLLTPTLLVVLLGANSFATRQAAESALPAFGPGPWIEWGGASGDAERKVRSDRVAGLFVADAADRLLVRFPTLPFIDALPPQHPGRVEIFRDYHDRAVVAGVPTTNGNDWPADRHATRLWIRDALRDGMQPDAALALLRVMAERSDWYMQHRNWPENMPELAPAPQPAGP